jgi:hypothetical protein
MLIFFPMNSDSFNKREAASEITMSSRRKGEVSLLHQPLNGSALSIYRVMTIFRALLLR